MTIYAEQYIQSASVNSTASGTTVVDIPFTAGTGAVIDYTVISQGGVNQRSGTIIATWNSNTSPYVAFSEVSTKDIGNTGTFFFNCVKVGNDFILRTEQTSGNWTIKVITRVIF
jgi:hypothetical protein